MRGSFFYLTLVLFTQFVFSQNGFYIENNSGKTVIPFEIYNNLVVIPVQVNGVPLKFLLDTGVKESFIFSIDETNEINFAHVEKINIRGFGGVETFEAYKSSKNNIRIKDFVDTNHTLYLILNQEINVSTQVGIPINGILGYYFFKNKLIKINYENRKITIYNDNKKQVAKIKNSFSKINLDFFSGKPYTKVNVVTEENATPITSNLLLDTGNSDAIWLFKERINNYSLPKVTLQDYLGRGLSGDIYGDRARIHEVKLDQFEFRKPLVAFPEIPVKKEIDSVTDRVGSIGSEIMKRFTTYYDYAENAMYIKKNSLFYEPFSYNMSGLEIQHQGVQWIKQTYQEGIQPTFNVFSDDGDKSITNNLKYKFELKPVYIISSIRKDSPADVAGLQKDDVIVKVNRRNGYSFKLQELNELLKSQEGKLIEIEVERNGKPLKFKFQLQSIL